MFSSNEPSPVPHSSEGAPNWAADTDPVGPYPFQREEGMSTAELGDSTLGQAPAPAPETPITPLTLTPPAQVEATAVAAPVVQPAAPIPVADMRDVPLGTLIFREGLLTEEQLEEALQDGMRRGKRLGEVLLERGLVSESDLGRLLAGQKGLQFVQLDAAAIDPTAVQLLPAEKARLHSVLPIGFQDGLPVVAVADPSNDLVIENVRRALNCEPRLVVAGREALHRQIEVAYAHPVAEPAPVVAEPVPVAPVVHVEPVAPVAVPVAQVSVEPAIAPAAPVVQAAPVSNGEGVWLGAPEPLVQPEPVLQAQPVVQPEPVVPSEPVQAPLETPVVPEPAPEPLSISYARDEPVVEPVFAPEPVAAAPVVAPEPVVVPEPQAPLAQQPANEPAAEELAIWSVVLRLADGERMDIGSFHSSEEATAHAQSVVEQISAQTGWPFFHGRFIRPEGIVSVDLLAPEGRWLGSAARRAWDSGPERA